MEIGERVRMLRKGKGMTQGDLANATRIVNQVYISRLETGRLKNVKPHIAKALSEALGVSLEYLILGDEPFIRPSGPGNQPVQVLSKVPDVSADHLFPEEEPMRRPARSGNQSVQRFLSIFLSLDPSQQAQVMNFTAFINRGEKDASGGGEESS